jgi:hypothetical protein
MSPFADARRRRVRGVAPVLIGLAAAAVMAVAVFAAPRRVASPHGKLDLECGVCHGAEGWTPAKISPKFDHAKYGFPLSGAHTATSCVGCHGSLEFKAADTRCVTCHEDPHRSEMGSDCARCHTARSFVDRSGMRRAHGLTRFPLTGGHAAIDCESCHAPVSSGHLQFVGTRADCAGCHLEDYRATTTPAHASSGFPTDCQSCHSTIAWGGAGFDHGRTAFPLTGAHRAVTCTGCHGDGVYRGKSSDCVACHRTEYDATTAPAHGPAGFPTACESCHGTTAWNGAAFNHATTAFPLTGAHVAAACTSCHGDGVYDGRSTECRSCHQSEYTATTDPNHAAASFPTTCQSCHGTATWDGARFDHDTSNFPIYSGGHRNRWQACADCHTNTANYQVFTCFSCHPHSDQAKTDGDHRGRSGYSYTSPACYSCHPRGNS